MTREVVQLQLRRRCIGKARLPLVGPKCHADKGPHRLKPAGDFGPADRKSGPNHCPTTTNTNSACNVSATLFQATRLDLLSSFYQVPYHWIFLCYRPSARGVETRKSRLVARICHNDIIQSGATAASHRLKHEALVLIELDRVLRM